MDRLADFCQSCTSTLFYYTSTCFSATSELASSASASCCAHLPRWCPCVKNEYTEVAGVEDYQRRTLPKSELAVNGGAFSVDDDISPTHIELAHNRQQQIMHDDDLLGVDEGFYSDVEEAGAGKKGKRKADKKVKAASKSSVKDTSKENNTKRIVKSNSNEKDDDFVVVSKVSTSSSSVTKPVTLPIAAPVIPSFPSAVSMSKNPRDLVDDHDLVEDEDTTEFETSGVEQVEGNKSTVTSTSSSSTSSSTATTTNSTRSNTSKSNSSNKNKGKRSGK